MNKSTITSKGQITIPKEVRETLKLDTGDVIVFKIDYDSSIVTFEKQRNEKPCSVCDGTGAIRGYECFICYGKGLVEESKNVWELIHQLIMDSSVYRVKISIITNGERIPQIKLSSSCYSEEIIAKAQDLFQMKFIEEYACKISEESNSPVIIGPMYYDEIANLLETEEAKEALLETLHGYDVVTLHSAEEKGTD